MSSCNEQIEFKSLTDLDLWDICELTGMMHAMLRADKYIFGESVHTFKIIKENKT